MERGGEKRSKQEEGRIVTKAGSPSSFRPRASLHEEDRHTHKQRLDSAPVPPLSSVFMGSRQARGGREGEGESAKRGTLG